MILTFSHVRLYTFFPLSDPHPSARRRHSHRRPSAQSVYRGIPFFFFFIPYRYSACALHLEKNSPGIILIKSSPSPSLFLSRCSKYRKTFPPHPIARCGPIKTSSSNFSRACSILPRTHEFGIFSRKRESITPAVIAHTHTHVEARGLEIKYYVNYKISEPKVHPLKAAAERARENSRQTKANERGEEGRQ